MIPYHGTTKKMYIIFFIICFLTTLLTPIHSYVLLAANIEDFRSLAKKLPKPLADQIVELAERKQETQKTNEREESDISIFSEKDSQGDVQDSSYEIVKEDYKENTNPTAIPRIHHDMKRSGSLLTIDEIVEKVKEKLETDLLTKMHSQIASNIKSNLANQGKNNKKVPANIENAEPLYEDAVYEEEVVTEPPKKIQRIMQNKLPARQGLRIVKPNTKIRFVEKPAIRQPAQMNKPYNQMQSQQQMYSPQVKVARQKEAAKGFVRQKPKIKRLQTTTEQPAYYVEDNTEIPPSTPQAVNEAGIYQAVDLIKQKDSYEDYVTPSKDEAFASDNEQVQMFTPGVVTLKRKKVYRKPLRKLPLTPTTARTVVTAEVNNAAAVEYYEDSKEAVTEPEMQALTEKLSSEEYEASEAEEVTTPIVTTTTNKRMKFGTMIPTRATFKLSSPNYYGSLPTIAEKYNFNEPIPEKDREPENLAQIGEPPSNINGKLRLN